MNRLVDIVEKSALLYSWNVTWSGLIKFLENLVEQNLPKLGEAITFPLTWITFVVLIVIIQFVKKLWEDGVFRGWFETCNRQPNDNDFLEVDDDYDEEIDISDYGLDSNVFDDAASFTSGNRFSDEYDGFSYSSDDEAAGWDCAVAFDSDETFKNKC
ncbi:unnamed protein product [Angiostrongylus costaricensis]|uniref:DUF4129 domain-containing protein n=1 Tax=Angiostrongylus costaricensis TaxID=334426 RepID=A0A0R3PEI5_ANGCS|nr:unnamed protein product [Angiostrongylus costaricensis]